MQGYPFYIDMRVLDIQAYDAIMSFDWLKTHSPINHHRENKTMDFLYQGKNITLQRILQGAMKVEGLPMDKMVKWLARKDIFALAIVDVQPHTTKEVHVHLELDRVLRAGNSVYSV